jgi:hypothetical protein
MRPAEAIRKIAALRAQGTPLRALADIVISHEGVAERARDRETRGGTWAGGRRYSPPSQMKHRRCAATNDEQKIIDNAIARAFEMLSKEPWGCIQTVRSPEWSGAGATRQNLGLHC